MVARVTNTIGSSAPYQNSGFKQGALADQPRNNFILVELRRTTEEACAHDVHPLSCDEYKPVYPSPLACIMRKEEMASKGCHIAIKHMMEKLGTGIVRHYVHPGHLDL